MTRRSQTLLDLNEVASRLGVTSRTVYRLIDDGELAAKQVVISGVRRRALRVSEDDLAEFEQRRDQVQEVA